MRGSDRAQRERDRALELEPSPEACLGALAAAARQGDRPRITRLLRFGLSRFPRQPELLALAAARGPQDPWPGPRGPRGSARTGRFPGPQAAQLRARRELPGVPQGPLRVDARGGVWLSCAPGGLLRVDEEGGIRAELGWPEEVPFALEEGRPTCYDAATGALREAPGWAFARLPGGLLGWSGRGELEGDAGEIGWRQTGSWLGEACGPRGLLVLGRYGPRGEGLEARLCAASGEVLARAKLGLLGAVADALWIGGEQPGWIVSSGRRLWRLGPALEPRWEREGPFLTRPACDGEVLVCAEERGLCAYEARDGAPRWEHLGLTLDHAPLLDGRGWVYVLSGGALLGLDPAGQRSLRLYLGREGPLGAPVLGGPGLLYLTGQRSLLTVV